MNIVCLDMEGVVTPEIWIALAENVGIEELKRTTRDEPDYDKLMQGRLEILRQHGMGLAKIQEVIGQMKPLEGAKEFLDELRKKTQVMIVSDTFEEFAMPLMAQLGYPTLLCNSLIVDEDGMITGYKMRVPGNTKEVTVKGMQAIGCETIASGDSFNDLGMIRASKAGFLFRTTKAIAEANPDVKAVDTYDDLLKEITAAL